MPTTSRPLAGRTVVITGGASGIGRALAQRLSSAGSSVAIADVDERSLKETEASLAAASLARTVDVRDAAAVQRFAAEVVDWATAPIAAVFNNAGVATSGTIADGVVEDEEWLWSINYDGVVNGTRAFLPLLQRQGFGVIVNTSSVYGLMGVPYESAYCASKFAVRGFTETLRNELRGSGLSAVVVHPGGIKTNIARNARVHGDPEGRGRTPDQIADEFDALAMTTAERAAQVIHEGVEKGRSRILIGADAKLIDTLARVSPTHGYRGLKAIEAVLSSRVGQFATKVLSR